MFRVGKVVKTVLIVTPVAISLYDQVGYVGIVRGRSMQPTLNPASSGWSDLVLIDRLTVKWRPASRGEVVVFTCPNDPWKTYVKRVIAVEGDVVRPRTHRSSRVIPKGHCWVEGDNGKSSNDSNYFGAVSLGLIRARVQYVVWPPSRVHHLQTGLLTDQKERLTIIDDITT
ncbi:mitochondrial inner membrane protease subunit 2-like isoform X1 [Dysidea avara]|uniref:mitochondrial inner membrane protease subunit 2-like isoform X1 n=1 Tax=Dysidea avara TaxID=196820 RepID=UPI0033276520